MIYCINVNSGQYKWATAAYITGSDYYEPKLAGQPEMARWRYGPGKTRGPVEIDRGSFKVLNADGAYDTLQSGGLEGKSGYCFTVLDDGTQVGLFAFICEVPVVDLEYVTISVKEWLAVFDKPMLTATYAGTGGLEGGSTNVGGSLKPLLMGETFNVEPILVNPAKLIYEFDALGGSASGVAGVSAGGPYDRRVTITSDGTYASEADLLDDALAPAAGKYKSYFPSGVGRTCIRLGSSPLGIVTANLTHTADATNGSGIRYLIARILARMSPAMTEDTWAILREINGSCGGAGCTMDLRSSVFLKDPITFLEALNLLCAGIGLSIFFRATVGLPTSGTGPMFRRQRYHSDETKSLSIGEAQIARGAVRLVRPNDPEQGAAIKKVWLGFRRNYRIMSKTDVPSSDSEAATVTPEYLYVTADTFSNSNKTTDLYIDTQLVNDGNVAITLAKYWAGEVVSSSVGVYSNPPQLIACEIADSQFIEFLHEVGTGANSARGVVFSSGITVTITHPRFGLSAGVVCTILGYRYTGRRTVELTLWKV